MHEHLDIITFLTLFGACACSASEPSAQGVDAGASGSGVGGSGASGNATGGSGVGGSGVSGSSSGGSSSGGSSSGGSASGNSGSSGAGAGDAGVLPNAEPDFSVSAGAIRVTTWLSSGETELVASFADAPALRFHRESERIGQCRLMMYEPSSCSPACSGSDACIDAQCRPYPVRVDRGPIDWEWPGGRQTVLASDTLNYHAIGAASTAGDVIVRVDGLTLGAPNDDSLAPDGDWGAAVAARAAASDVTLRWTNPSPGARMRFHMTDCTGSHGGFAAAELECEGPDSGALVLPGAFLDRLDAGEWSRGECGVHTVERYRVASAEGDTGVRLETIARANLFYRPE
jgi:hypothetical protein